MLMVGLIHYHLHNSPPKDPVVDQLNEF